MNEAATTCLPFDQYQRYRLVADILEQIRGERKPLTLLEVGGRTALLRRFLPEDRVHIVDVEPSGEPGLVLGDGSHLPFADSSVDAVVTFDTLEHVPPPRREAFISECARVARRWVVVAGPFATSGVEDAEELLDTFLRDKLGIEHRYLGEHRRFGLPDLAATERQLRQLGARVRSVGHANLDRWLALMCLSMYVDRDGPLRVIGPRFFEFYNRALYASDHAPPVYRHAVVAALKRAKLPDPNALLGAPEPPSEALEPISHLVRELLAFDVERDVVSAEWQRLEEANRAVRLDLEGHKDTLGLLQEIRDEQFKVIEDFRRQCIELRANEDRLEAELEREREESGRVIATLETDLREHRTKLAEVEKDLAAHREEVAARSAHEEELRRELERRSELLASERSAFAEVRTSLEADLAALREEDESRRTHEAALSAELTHRGELLASERSAFAEVRTSLEADLAALREELESRRTHEAALSAELTHRGELLASERSAFEEVRSSLEADLAALREELESRRTHDAALSAELAHRDEQLAAERAAWEEARTSLEADLAALREEVESRRAHEAALSEELDRRGEQLAAERTSLEADLAALREEVESRRAREAELSAELARRGEQLASERAAWEESRSSMEARLAEGAEELASLRSRESELRDEVRGLRRELAEERQRIANLRLDLADRWKNLRRAFGRRREGR